MSTSSRVGAKIGKWSIAIAALCFVVTPIFTPAIVAAAFVGALGGVVAFALGARRIALVAIAVALIPLGGLLMLQFFDSSAMSSYLVLAPLVAVLAAVVVLLNGGGPYEDVADDPFRRS